MSIPPLVDPYFNCCNLCLECLLLLGSFWNLESLFSRIHNTLNLCHQSIRIFLHLGCQFYCLLHQQLNIPQFTKVEIPLPLQPRNTLFEQVNLDLQCRAIRCRTNSPSKWGSSTSGCAYGRGGASLDCCGGCAGGWASSSGDTLTFSSRNGIIFASGVELVPVSFSPLEEFEVILEFAFYETLDREGTVNSALSEDVWRLRLVGGHWRMERV